METYREESYLVICIIALIIALTASLLALYLGIKVGVKNGHSLIVFSMNVMQIIYSIAVYFVDTLVLSFNYDQFIVAEVISMYAGVVSTLLSNILAFAAVYILYFRKTIPLVPYFHHIMFWCSFPGIVICIAYLCVSYPEDKRDPNAQNTILLSAYYYLRIASIALNFIFSALTLYKIHSMSSNRYFSNIWSQKQKRTRNQTITDPVASSSFSQNMNNATNNNTIRNSSIFSTSFLSSKHHNNTNGNMASTANSNVIRKPSLYEVALRTLAKRMVLYPIVQALGRSGFAWYEGVYGNTVLSIDAVSQEQYQAMVFCVLVTPMISVGYLMIFIFMQPEAKIWLYKLVFGTCFWEKEEETSPTSPRRYLDKHTNKFSRNNSETGMHPEQSVQSGSYSFSGKQHVGDLLENDQENLSPEDILANQTRQSHMNNPNLQRFAQHTEAQLNRNFNYSNNNKLNMDGTMNIPPEEDEYQIPQDLSYSQPSQLYYSQTVSHCNPHSLPPSQYHHYTYNCTFNYQPNYHETYDYDSDGLDDDDLYDIISETVPVISNNTNHNSYPTNNVPQVMTNPVHDASVLHSHGADTYPPKSISSSLTNSNHPSVASSLNNCPSGMMSTSLTPTLSSSTSTAAPCQEMKDGSNSVMKKRANNTNTLVPQDTHTSNYNRNKFSGEFVPPFSQSTEVIELKEGTLQKGILDLAHVTEYPA